MPEIVKPYRSHPGFLGEFAEPFRNREHWTDMRPKSLREAAAAA